MTTLIDDTETIETLHRITTELTLLAATVETLATKDVITVCADCMLAREFDRQPTDRQPGGQDFSRFFCGDCGSPLEDACFRYAR